jgi:hypothetical protein
MDHWKQLGLPVALGLVAAALNWYSVSSKVQPTAYVSVNQHVEPGDTITEHMLTKLEITGDHGMSRAAYPWEQRSMLFRWRATRRLQKGSVVLRRDVVHDRADVAPGEHEFTVNIGEFDTPPDLYEDSYVSFALTDDDRFGDLRANAGRFGVKAGADRFVGPFRIVAITYGPPDETTGAGAPRINTLTLVARKTPEGRGRMERLLRALRHDAGEHVLAIVRESESEGETDELAARDAGANNSAAEG